MLNVLRLIRCFDRKDNLLPHMVQSHYCFLKPTELHIIECCRDGDFCNQRLKPTFPGKIYYATTAAVVGNPTFVSGDTRVHPGFLRERSKAESGHRVLGRGSNPLTPSPPAGSGAEPRPPEGFHYFQHSGWPLLTL